MRAYSLRQNLACLGMLYTHPLGCRYIMDEFFQR